MAAQFPAGGRVTCCACAIEEPAMSSVATRYGLMLSMISLVGKRQNGAALRMVAPAECGKMARNPVVGRDPHHSRRAGLGGHASRLLSPAGVLSASFRASLSAL